MSVAAYGSGVIQERKQEILRALDNLLDRAKRMRAYVPAIAEKENAKRNTLTVPEFYTGLRPAPEQIVFRDGMTNDDVDRHNDLAHWMNQNVIIRLCSVLDVHSVMKVLRKQSRHVDFLYHLRQEFAHGRGKLKPQLHKQFKELLPDVDTSDSETRGEYCLAVDQVIEQLVLKVKQAVELLPVEGETSLEALRVELQQRIREPSFKPFRLALSDGGYCDVTHPGMNMVADTYIVVGHPALDDPNPIYYDRTETVALAAIVGVSSMPHNSASA